MKKKVLRVGFDLDGVIIYNPVRIIRPIIAWIKKYFLKKRVVKFYYPRSSLEKTLWALFHYSSLFVAPGYKDIKRLVNEGKIKAYLISSRYSFLKGDFVRWLKKIEAEKYFSGWFYNKDNEQPHLFKEKVIKKLDLDIFIEDNWDIINYLNSKLKIKNSKCKAFWIYNLFDRNINYPYKFSSLKQAVNEVKKNSQNKKRVLIVTDYFYPHWTGISKSLNYLTQALKDKFLFTVLTVRYKKSLKQNETVRDIEIIRENPISKISRAHYSLSLLWRFIKEGKNYDIVFINSPLTNILPISLLAKLFMKKLLIFHQGDLILPKGILNRTIEKIFDFSSHISFLLANKVATYTEDYAHNSRIMKYYLDKFFPLLIPITISNKKIETNIKKLSLIKKEGKIIFGFAGRFVEEKGFDVLLKAIPQVIEKNPKAVFVFAGETNIHYENFYQKNLDMIKKLRKHLIFLGLLNNNDLAYYYQNIDFIVLPSRSDCFPLVQAEAMICGIPSIVSDIPGARFLVKNSHFGLIFKKEDPEDLAGKIIKAVKDKNVFLKNHKKVLEIFDARKNVKAIRQFIES